MPRTRFDDDTALHAHGDGRWTGEVRERWYVGRGANGGLIAAQATRALLDLAAAAGTPDRAPRSLTLQYLEAPVAGPIELAVTVERSGGSTTACSLRFEQAGRTVATGLAGLASWRPGGFELSEAEPPRVPRPGELPEADRDAPGLPAFVGNYDWRWATDGGGARTGGWIRTRDPRPVDAVAIAAFADAFPPAVFGAIGPERAAAPTLDLTIHFRAPLDDVGDGWVLGAFRSRRVAGGFFEEDGELYSEAGELLAQSRQLALLRERR